MLCVCVCVCVCVQGLKEGHSKEVREAGETNTESHRGIDTSVIGCGQHSIDHTPSLVTGERLQGEEEEEGGALASAVAAAGAEQKNEDDSD